MVTLVGCAGAEEFGVYLRVDRILLNMLGEEACLRQARAKRTKKSSLRFFVELKKKKKSERG